MKNTLLFTLILAALPAAALDCPSAYRDPVYKDVWTLSKTDWNAACAAAKAPETILAAAKDRFAKECLEKSAESIQAGLISRERAAELCSLGSPGQAKIPRKADAAPRPRQDKGAARVGKIDEGVQAFLAGDIAGLYGERSGAVVDAHPAPPGSFPTSALNSRIIPRLPPKGFTPSAPPPPDSPNAERDKNIKILESYIVPHEASKEAIAIAHKLMTGMLGQADPVVVQNMVDSRVHLVIIPKDKKMTDLPEFAALKGKKTIDGRLWDNVRGVGDTRLKDGGVALGVAEETLIGPTGYHKGHVFVHEMGHIIQDHGLPRGLKAETNRIYNEDVKRKEKTGLGKYADSNTSEHFAQASAAYLGVSNFGRNDEIKDAAAIRKNNPALYGLLYKIYGPPRDLTP